MNLIVCALLIAAAPATDDARFDVFAQKYVQELLDRDPETATRLGDHRNDARLDDYSAKGVERDLAAAKSGLAELARIDPKKLSAEDAVDYRILKNRLESQVYELQTLRGWQWNPLQYNVGGAIYAMISREFAPPEQRLRSVIGRLNAVPGVVAAAKANLKDPPKVHTETAIQQNKGTTRLVKEQLEPLVKQAPGLEKDFRAAQAQTSSFVKEKGFVTVLEEPLEVVATPEFQRGVAVASCSPPGPLEKNKKTFYYISPTPADWRPERVESFFREYNDSMLQDLTIHEAMPGHYLQLAHANRFRAPTLVRGVIFSGTFVEGWATYAEQLMADAGYGGPEVRMQQLKMRLRMILNAVIDQKIHTDGMSEKDAIARMMNDGFQEEGEAVGKWKRAQLTSTQLSTYYVGNAEMNDIRAAWEKNHGKYSDLRALHDAMLSFGNAAPKYVKERLGLSGGSG